MTHKAMFVFNQRELKKLPLEISGAWERGK